VSQNSSNDSPLGELVKAPVKRRDFLKVLGVSGAGVAATACSEKTGNLIPYLVSPDQTVPGVSTYYATTCRECAAACGVIAETRDGRVIKLEGNPAHPLNRGALCARGQSAVQGLYNPDRLRVPMMRDGNTWKNVTWDEGVTLLAQKLGQGRGKESVFFNQHESGSFPAFIDEWLASFGLRPHLSVDFEADQAAMAANRAAFGTSMPKLNFADAKLIVSFGADFLEGWGASVPQQLDFAESRAKLDGAPRFIYIGPRRSLTGLNADQWIACKPGGELAIANFLRGQGSSADAAKAADVPEPTLKALQAEVAGAKPGLFLSGSRSVDAMQLATAVAGLNQGGVIRAGEGSSAFDGVASADQVLAAVEDMRAGRVGVLFVRGANPVHSLPKAANVADALKKVPFKVAFSLYPDETTELCDLIFPDLHSLESWGDAQPVKGTIGLVQPAMDPVFKGTKSAGDVMILAAKKDASAASKYAMADYKTWFLARVGGTSPTFAGALQKGMMPGAAMPRTAPAATATTKVAALPAPRQNEYFLITYPSPTLGDGRGANKPWLQELPDPVTKVVWSSWVEMHPDTAAKLDITRGDIVEVKTATGTLKLPAYLYLGVRPDTLAIPLGQGHRSDTKMAIFEPKHHEQGKVEWGYGRYARGVLDGHPLDIVTVAINSAGGLASIATTAMINKTGDSETIPSTEGSARQHGRGIAQALTVEELLKGDTEGREHETLPGDANHAFLPGLRSPTAADAQGDLGSPTAADKGNKKGLYRDDDPRKMTSRRWAMTIDLARCTGCSACVTACYAENNIPTVGAAWQNATIFADAKFGINITRGREMNWLRIERYYEGAYDGHFGEDFEARFVPMLCQHCGNAPCEPVCPVYATYHSPDGLNVQVYNRCVGTRYCSNNCPYKVRYFNWFGYGEADRKQFAFPEPLNWQLNPDVTVRGKGVMEKCSFCVQRIREAENRAVLEHRDLQPDEFTSACAAACPSRAIVFGDAADPNWTVAQMANDRRAYHVFEELNTYTAVVYLKKVNHPAGAERAAAN
jgi:anaerobic selenocysteine-containing dehydrogenase/Fe-S-cluster-containing dehydrogenase component